MKIAILLPDLRGGGVETVRLLLAREFVAQGHEVDFILVTKRGVLLDTAEEEFRVHGLGCDRLRSAPRVLRAFLARQGYDILLAAMWPLTAIAVLATAFTSIRVIVSEHNDLRQVAAIKQWERIGLKLLGRIIYSRAHSVVSVSKGVAESIEAVSGFPADRVNVIYNPIRKHSPAAESLDREIIDWWSSGELRLVAVGSLKPAKDHRTMFRAVAELNHQVNARLLLLGDGPLRHELQTFLDGSEAGPHVRMPGFVANPYPYLARADCFVMSSAWEGLGNVIIEALSAGTQVVATNCASGPAEILMDGKYGNLVPVGDWRSLSASIKSLCESGFDPDFLKSRAADFKPERAAREYLSLVESLD